MRTSPSLAGARLVTAILAIVLMQAAPRTAMADARSPEAAPGDADDDKDDRGGDRYPQAIRVGELIGRAVLRPDEDRGVIGHIRSIVRLGDGSLEVVMDQGGLFGFGTKTVALPLDQLALLGQDTALPDFQAADAASFPIFTRGSATPLPAEAVVMVGLAKPFH